MVKASELGKVTNMLSNDFNLIELKMPIGFAASIFPFGIIGAAIVLGFRLGWPAIIGISIPLLTFPLLAYVGKKNG